MSPRSIRARRPRLPHIMLIRAVPPLRRRPVVITRDLCVLGLRISVPRARSSCTKETLQHTRRAIRTRRPRCLVPVEINVPRVGASGTHAAAHAARRELLLGDVGGLGPAVCLPGELVAASVEVAAYTGAGHAFSLLGFGAGSTVLFM